MADKIDPSAARLLELHARMIGGDHTAIEQLVVELRLPLCRRLRRSFPRATVDLVADASNDALLMYAARPYEFDVSRLVPLDHFLYGVAARILRDRLRSDKRRGARESDYGKQILLTDGHRSYERVTSHTAVQEVRRALALVCEPAELAAMVAWLDEDDTGVVAVCLGVSHLGAAEQRREVRRFTARVVKRLQRLLEGGNAQARQRVNG